MKTEPTFTVTIATETDDPTLTEALDDLELTANIDMLPDTRRGGELLGPVLQYVLPGVASLSVTFKLIQALARGWRTGSIVELSDDGKVSVRKDETLPRGMVVVKRNKDTIEVLDTNQDGSIEKLADLLRKPPSA